MACEIGQKQKTLENLDYLETLEILEILAFLALPAIPSPPLRQATSLLPHSQRLNRLRPFLPEMD